MSANLLPGINATVDKLMSRLAEAERQRDHTTCAKTRSALQHEISGLERKLGMAERMQDRILAGKGPQ